MQLSDLLSATQLNDLRNVASAPSLASQYAPSLGPNTQDFFYELAAQHDCICTQDFWQRIEKAVVSGTRWFVHLVDGEATVCDLDFMLNRAPANCLWKMGEYLKAGDGCVLIRNGKVTYVNWNNWKRIYSELSGHTDAQVYDPEMTGRQIRCIRTNRKREKMFDDARAVDNYKKGGKNRSMNFEEHRAIYRREQYDKYTRGVKREFNAIMEAI